MPRMRRDAPKLDTACGQPFAGLLPAEVSAPGAPVAAITAAAAAATGLPEACLVCAGTTGAPGAPPQPLVSIGVCTAPAVIEAASQRRTTACLTCALWLRDCSETQHPRTNA
jgi:hypothetical protein